MQVPVALQISIDIGSAGRTPAVSASNSGQEHAYRKGAEA
jgi:hypothetical protein